MLLCSPELCARREVVGSPAVKKEATCGSGWGRSDPDFLVSEDSCVKWWKFLSSLGAFLIHNKAQAYGSVPLTESSFPKVLIQFEEIKQIFKIDNAFLFFRECCE